MKLQLPNRPLLQLTLKTQQNNLSASFVIVIFLLLVQHKKHVLSSRSKLRRIWEPFLDGETLAGSRRWERFVQRQLAGGWNCGTSTTITSQQPLPPKWAKHSYPFLSNFWSNSAIATVWPWEDRFLLTIPNRIPLASSPLTAKNSPPPKF